MSIITTPTYYRPLYSEKEHNMFNQFSQMMSQAKAIAAVESPVSEPGNFDASVLSDVGKDLQSIADSAEDAANAAADKAQKEQNEKDNEKAKSDGTPEDTDNDGFMTLIFKIVPIGINVLKKGPVLVKGLKDMIQGTIDLVKNLAISSVILFIDTFTFVAEGFYFVFTLLLCGVLNLGNLHKCILFYLFDLFLLAIYMIIVSVLLLIDVFFNVKQYTGISCVEELNIIIDTIPVLDDIIYQMTTIHLFRYPDFIINLCYRCELMGDTKPFFDTAHKFNYDATQLVPTSIGRAISEVTGGIGDIVSIFSI
jgi:hypothetical protein